MSNLYPVTFYNAIWLILFGSLFFNWSWIVFVIVVLFCPTWLHAREYADARKNAKKLHENV